MALFVFGEAFVARDRVWWWFYKSLHPKILGLIPMIVGPFFVGSLWILKFTFGRFYRFVALNLIVDSIFTYVLMDWFKKIGYLSLVRIEKYQLSILFMFKTLLMYSFQYIVEKCMNRDKRIDESKILQQFE